jgi:hypothetical protein
LNGKESIDANTRMTNVRIIQKDFKAATIKNDSRAIMNTQQKQISANK